MEIHTRRFVVIKTFVTLLLSAFKTVVSRNAVTQSTLREFCQTNVYSFERTTSAGRTHLITIYLIFFSSFVKRPIGSTQKTKETIHKSIMCKKAVLYMYNCIRDVYSKYT